MRRKLVKVYVQRLNNEVQLPSYARDGDSGMDIRSAVDLVIGAGETRAIPTGLSFAVPAGYEWQVRPRSGLSIKTGLRVANTPGTIDSGYRDEVKILIHNTSRDPYVISKGDRIAQLVLMKVPEAVLYEVEDVKSFGKNRGGGFGHTGDK